MTTCEDDFDCPGSQICFNVEDTATNKTNFCDCNANLGWTGENCEGLIPAYAFIMALNLVFFVGLAGVMLYAVVKDTMIICRTPQLHWNVVTFHWVLLLLTMINYEVVIFTYSTNFFTPEGFKNGTTLTIDNELLKFDARGTSASISAVLYIFFIFILYTSISLSWVQSARKIELFTTVINDRTIKYLKRVIYFNTFVVLVTLFVVTLLGYIAYYLFVIIIDGSLVVMVFFCWGYQRFGNLLKEISKAGSKLSQANNDQTSSENRSLQKERVNTASRAYDLIYRTAVSTMTSFATYIIGGVLIISFEYTHEKKEPIPNRLNLSLIGFEIQVISSLFGMLLMYNYVRRTIQGSAAYFKQNNVLDATVSNTNEL